MNTILQLAQAYAEAKVVAQAGGDVADVSRAWAALKEAARDAERYRKLSAAYAAANFRPELELGLDPGTALIFWWPRDLVVSADLDETVDAIDQAMQESALRRMHDLSKDIGQEL